MLVAQPAPAAAVPAPPLTEAYTVFCGNIDQDSARRILQGLAVATNPAARIGHVHLLFQSTGGTVADGICLYNFFRTLPVDLTIYNVGSVTSIAVVAYLGAKRRKTSAHATFMIHRTTSSPQGAATGTLQAIAKSTALDDARTEAILRAHIKLPDADWSNLDKQPLFFSADEAVKIEMADEIGDFSPPKGSQIFYFP